MFEPGLYAVGDLCYILRDEWAEVCELTIQGNTCLDGEFTLKDGRKFAVLRTAYGDGEYRDQYGRNYPVDSGSIGLIQVEQEDESVFGMNFIQFDAPFEVSSEGGVIKVGIVEIDTDPWDEEVA